MSAKSYASKWVVPIVMFVLASVSADAHNPPPIGHRSRTITLDNPAADAVIPQNDPTIGCAFGFIIDFQWTTLRPLRPGDTFTLVLQHIGSTAPALLQEGLTDPSFTLDECNSFVIDSNLSNWYWEVMVVAPDGSVSTTSVQSPLSFAPCRLSGGQACNAPAP